MGANPSKFFDSLPRNVEAKGSLRESYILFVFSGAYLNISSTHSSGDVFPVGETSVYYTATDPSGNNRTCELIITVQGKRCFCNLTHTSCFM